jgi:hypothetical protein
VSLAFHLTWSNIRLPPIWSYFRGRYKEVPYWMSLICSHHQTPQLKLVILYETMNSSKVGARWEFILTF